MASAEERARREAVARVLAGQPTTKVAADLGRSDRWVRKWVARFDPSETGWAADRSRAPAIVANRTPAELERVVLAVRQRLMDDPWAQVGAAAIAWELTKLGLEPPAVWTIDRILRRAGVAKRRARGRYVPKGTPYPAGRAVVRPGARQEIDLVGPRYLAGATAFHVLNAVDVGRRRCGIEILASKEERAVVEGLVRLWRRLGVPKVAQFDNGQTLQGRGRVLALPVRLCLALGVRVRFIPFAEPWRNGVVEHFNDVFDKRFFRTEQFHGLHHLAQRAQVFEDFHNAHHRYSALHGATPAEWEARWQWTPRLLDPTFTPPTALPRRGRIDFVRLIRSDRLLKILGVKLPVPETLIHRYVTATLHVRRERLVATCDDLWRMEVPFILKP
jgi:putative transposase